MDQKTDMPVAGEPAAGAVAAAQDAPLELDVADLDAADEAQMTVVMNGRLTTWVWTFAGPGHARTVAQSNRLAREHLFEESQKEQAQVNRKKWKAQEENPDEVRARNVNYVLERLLGWTPVKLNGEQLAFTPEAAKKLLLDPRKGALLAQALEFIADDKSFIKRSAKT